MQPDDVYLDGSISIRYLCPKKLVRILLLVLATVVMQSGKKLVVRAAAEAQAV